MTYAVDCAWISAPDQPGRRLDNGQNSPTSECVCSSTVRPHRLINAGGEQLEASHSIPIFNEMDVVRYFKFKLHVCTKSWKPYGKEVCYTRTDPLTRSYTSDLTESINRAFITTSVCGARTIPVYVNESWISLQLEPAADVNLTFQRTWEQLGRPKLQGTSQRACNFPKTNGKLLVK